MAPAEATRQQITKLIENDEIVLFMKGTRGAPQCGFSATVVQILDTYVSEYATIDVLANPDIRDGIKAFSSWPTIPQLYVKGEFVGGCDIIKELAVSNELAETLGVTPAPVVTPKIQITDTAANILRALQAQHGGPDRSLHLSVDARYQSGLSMAPNQALDMAVESNGVTLMIDRLSAGRADGITLDATETPQGPSFKVDNPNAPQPKPMSVQQLKQALDAEESFELFDVRPPEELATASIPAASQMNEQEAERLESLPKNTKVVFLCHHGLRSQAAAAHYMALGFSDVYSVEGGIDVWSQEVDPSVPRY